MCKRKLSSKLEPSEVVGSGEVCYDLLVEYSPIVRFKYRFLSSSKKQVLREISEYFNKKFLSFAEDDETWTLKVEGVFSAESYTLIKVYDNGEYM